MDSTLSICTYAGKCPKQCLRSLIDLKVGSWFTLSQKFCGQESLCFWRCLWELIRVVRTW